jgi:adenine phosphoribosyltransferase
MISNLIAAAIRDVPNFPKEGILFKDITPIFAQPKLCAQITEELVKHCKALKIDVIVGVESRGFFFGFHLAQALQVPFVPIRKAGKLPYHAVSEEYALEYGTAKIEMHIDAITAGQNVLIHDDLLATGGTAAAAARLIKRQGGNISAFAFLVELGFLNGAEVIAPECKNIISLVKY